MELRIWAIAGFFVTLFANLTTAQIPPDWRVDKSLYPKAYGVLADERLMHPVNMSDWPVKIDSTRQLFVDDELIATQHNVRRKLNPARKHPANPLVVPDKPWEGGNCFFQHVIRDPQSGRFRMWYSASPQYTPSAGKRAPWVSCYAESSDGLNWDKPSLGLHEIEGSRQNNVIIPDGSFFGVMYTPDDPQPSRRYKGMVLRFQNQPLEGYYLYTSPDGIRWTREREQSVVPSQHGYELPTGGIGDTTFFRWDTRLKNYIGDVKFVFPGTMRVRGISESDDLIHWTRPKMTIFPDGLDPAQSQIYGHIGFEYESMWIGLMRLMHNNLVEGSYKQTTVELTSSRDGRHWHRLTDRSQFIPFGAPTEWDPHYLDPCSPPVVVGDELWFYYRSMPLWNDRRDKVSRIGLAMIGRDRFASLSAEDPPGLVVTRPLSFSGRRLFVNANVRPQGSLRVELRHTNGTPFDGFGFSQSTTVAGDVLKQLVAWGQKEFPSIANSQLRLAFELKQAEIFSFWWE